jgi:curved DNA-binding protein CbpA
MADLIDYYQLLDVPQDASLDTIRTAYLKEMKKVHPDHQSNHEESPVARLLNDAYATLKDPAKRRAYDQRLRGRAVAQNARPSNEGSAGQDPKQGQTNQTGQRSRTNEKKAPNDGKTSGQKTETPKEPEKRLTLDVIDPQQSDDQLSFNAIAIRSENGKPRARVEVVFYLDGEEKGRQQTNESGRAMCPLIVTIKNLRGENVLVEAICEGLREKVTKSLPTPKTMPAADKLNVRADGKDGRHTVYIGVTTQDKKPIPGIHVVIKNSAGEEVFRGITNERGTIFPHPTIEIKTTGTHHFVAIAEGTSCQHEQMNLDGPPRYPKPPEPPQEIPEEERGHIGKNPFKAIISAWKAGRRALQEQRRAQ